VSPNDESEPVDIVLQKHGTGSGLEAFGSVEQCLLKNEAIGSGVFLRLALRGDHYGVFSTFEKRLMRRFQVGE
jgi:hypothetical protein